MALWPVGRATHEDRGIDPESFADGDLTLVRMRQIHSDQHE
jgi:hypothetical protein